jgi:hypothetical protein
MCETVIKVFKCGCTKTSTIKTCNMVGKKGHTYIHSKKTVKMPESCNECYVEDDFTTQSWEIWDEEEEKEEGKKQH